MIHMKMCNEMNEGWAKIQDLVSTQKEAAFLVIEETMIEISAIDENQQPEEFSSAITIFVTLIDCIRNGVLFCVAQDAELGWCYFDTFSVRFFTHAIILTTEKSPSLLAHMMDILFNDGAQDPPLGRYLRRVTIVSAACCTLLTEWLWKSFSQSAFDYSQAESTGVRVSARQQNLWNDIQTALQILTIATMNYQDGNKSPLASMIIQIAQQTLTGHLNNSCSIASSTFISDSASSPMPHSCSYNVSVRSSLELFDTIQRARNEEMKRRGVAQISVDEMAVTLPLILRVINSSSSSCSRGTREVALYCLLTLTDVSVRDELVRFGYLKSILYTILPVILGQQQLDDVANSSLLMTSCISDNGEMVTRSIFTNLVRNHPADSSFVRLDDFPREYIEISSPQNVMKSLFHVIRSHTQTTPRSITPVVLSQYITCLVIWYDALVRAQKEELIIAPVVTAVAGVSQLMMIDLIRQMYDYFIEFTSTDTVTNYISISAEHHDADATSKQQQQLESIESFKIRTSAVTLCARLLTDSITPSSFIEERITLLTDRMIHDLMQQTCTTLNVESGQVNPLAFHREIVQDRIVMSVTLQLLAKLNFNRPSSYVASLVSLLLRVSDAQYGNTDMTALSSLMQIDDQHRIDITVLIDHERTAALECAQVIINHWNKEELSDITPLITTAIMTNHHSYIVTSQEKAIEIVSAVVVASLDLFLDTNEENVAPLRGVDRTLSNDLSDFIMSARQFFFNIILHTPNRAIAQLVFKELSFLIALYGQVVLTRGDITLYDANVSPPSVAAPISSSTFPSATSTSTSLPAMTAYTIVCRMFLSSRLPCQNTELRRTCGPREIVSYVTADQLPPQTLKAFASECMMGAATTTGQEVKAEDESSEEDPCHDDQDERPMENASLMTAFFNPILLSSTLLTTSHFLSSVFVPILPVLRRFHSRTWNHELASAAFIHNLHHQLGAELSTHFDSAIIILATLLMSLGEKSPEVVQTLGWIHKTARDIIAAEPQLDLVKILPDQAMRINFEQMIAQP